MFVLSVEGFGLLAAAVLFEPKTSRMCCRQEKGQDLRQGPEAKVI